MDFAFKVLILLLSLLRARARPAVFFACMWHAKILILGQTRRGGDSRKEKLVWQKHDSLKNFLEDTVSLNISLHERCRLHGVLTMARENAHH